MRFRQAKTASLVLLSVALAVPIAHAQVVNPLDRSTDYPPHGEQLSATKATDQSADSPALVERITALEAELDTVRKELDRLGKQSGGTAREPGDVEDWIDSSDDYPTFHAGGVLNFDMASFRQDTRNIDSVGDIEDGVEIRRARLYVHGDVSQVIGYCFSFDVAGAVEDDLGNSRTRGEVVFLSNYVQVRDLPYLGSARVGHLTEPFGLERLTSSRYIPFMERGLLTAFTPGKNLGGMVFNHAEGERFTWQLGCFRSDFSSLSGVDTGDGGGWSATGRVTCLPWYDEATEGRGLFHLGAAISYRDTHDDEFRFRQRPETDLAPYFVDTEAIGDAPALTLLGAEAACVCGPFSLQSELIQAFVARSGAPDLNYHGVYVTASWFLTGEQRSYHRTSGNFGGVEPHEEFFLARTENRQIVLGKGAWELAARWSYLDLNDADVLGGRLSDTTLGVNWYLNRYTRMMFNYVHAELADPIGGSNGADIFETRLQIEF